MSQNYANSNTSQLAAGHTSGEQSTGSPVGVLSSFWGSIVHPVGTFERIASSGLSSRLGWTYTIGYGVLYSLTALVLALFVGIGAT